MLKGKLIICYSGTSWNFPWGISQRIMDRLTDKNKIVYVEYQPSFLHYCIRSLSFIKYSHQGRGEIKERGNNLNIYTPQMGLPFNNYFRMVNILNHRNTARDVKREISKYNSRDIILWIFVPYAIDFIKELGNFFTIYHCAGNYPIEKNNLLRKRTVSKMEKELVSRSDIVVAQTESLCRRFGSLGKNTFCLPSVVDTKHYERRLDDSSFDDREFAGIKHPRIGVVGYFDDTFYDTDILEYLLDTRKKWSFVFIGPITEKGKSFRRFEKKSNAFFLGYKDPDEVPNYIKRLDLGIIPYKINRYTNEVSPNKFYEYIACGKAVVSTDIPSIKKYADVLKIANHKTEFLKSIDDILSKGKAQFIEKKALEIARENSLDGYLERLSEEIEKGINEKAY